MIKKLGGYVLFCLFTGISIANASPFQNGDFSTGDFTGWMGQLDNGISVQTVDPDTSSYFTIVDHDNKAEISLDDTYWQNTLYQNFQLDSLPPGWTMDMNFWIKWSPTSNMDDGISVTLSDLTGDNQVDLIADISNSALLNGISVTKDITPFAQTFGGQNVGLAFSIGDYDLNSSDTLKIDDIAFNKNPAPVPVPGTLLLLGSGLAGLGVWGRRKR